MDYIGGRHDRILAIYNNLIEGAGLNVKSAAEFYGVSTKTIKRDIDDIRNFLSEKRSADGSVREVLQGQQNGDRILSLLVLLILLLTSRRKYLFRGQPCR